MQGDHKCRNPHCDRNGFSRGLCKICYNRIRHMVLAGEFTWEDLEFRGKITRSQKMEPKEDVVKTKEWLRSD